MKRYTVVLVYWTFVLAALCPRFLIADEAIDYKKLYEEQKARNDQLEKRLAIVEETVQGDKFVKKENVTETAASFLKTTEISGFVSSSYFYNFNRPSSRENTGRGFDTMSGEFMFNKAVIKLERPVEYNAFDWAAGYNVTTVFGQDAGYMQAAGFDLGTDGDVFEANITINAPVGNGLKLTIGEYGTVIGYESTMTEQNYNWSGGYLWTLAEPFTHTGLMLAYQLCPDWEVKLLVNNGWDVLVDNNTALSYVGQLTWTPNDNNTIALIGYGGPEQDNNSSNWRSGFEAWVEHRCSAKFLTAAQFDYGQESGADANGGTANWYGISGWLIYEPVEKWSAAVRTDYFNDRDGARTTDAPGNAPFAPNTGQGLYSTTLTINFKPVPEVRIAPELRWDHSTWDMAFDGHADQITVGFGVAYFY